MVGISSQHTSNGKVSPQGLLSAILSSALAYATVSPPCCAGYGQPHWSQPAYSEAPAAPSQYPGAGHSYSSAYAAPTTPALAQPVGEPCFAVVLAAPLAHVATLHRPEHGTCNQPAWAFDRPAAVSTFAHLMPQPSPPQA